jgi:hypothetical protein
MPASLTFTGTVELGQPNNQELTPFSTRVDLVRPDGMVAQSTTSDAAGKFTMTVQTQGVPLDLALRSHGMNGYPDAYLYFPVPFTQDQGLELSTPAPSTLQGWASAASAPYASTSMVVLGVITSAAVQPISGERVSTGQASSNVVLCYLDDQNQLNRTQTMTTSKGGFFIFDQEANDLTLTASGPAVVAPRSVLGAPGSFVLILLLGEPAP